MKTFNILNHNPRTLIWWFNRRDEIDFEPLYQRRSRLWSTEDKAYLIDSIINGFDVPKLYLADFQYGKSALNKTNRPYAIIDGKQRLEAVFDFFENRLILNDNFKYRKDPSLKLGRLCLKDLRRSYPRVAEDFENASLDIKSVVAEEEVDINEIFVRLNKSKPLTGAEVRNAVSGPIPELIRVISKHEFFVENIRFSVNRAADLNAAAKLLLFECSQNQTSTKKQDLDKFAKMGESPEKLELAGRQVLDTLSLMNEVFIPRDSLLSSAGIVPVYYWFIRGIDYKDLWSVRLFLLHFEWNRKSIQNINKVNRTQVLSRFNTFNRSTNDLQSHVGRVGILKSYFEEWKKSGTYNDLKNLSINLEL